MVGNFGVSGSTVVRNTALPYIYEIAFIGARNFLPDIVVIMLGTNDARTDTYKSIDDFINDYKMLIHGFQALESSPKIFLVKPPPIFDNVLELKSANLLEGVIPRIEQVANELDLPLIDVYSALKDYPNYFQDGVHPNSEGAAIIANQVYNAISLWAETS